MTTHRIVEQIEYVEVSPLLINNAIRIYQHWKQLDAEVRAISTRGINFPGELSELFVCYALGLLQKKNGSGDAKDPKTNKIIEIKGSGSEGSDLSSFSPSEDFDELVFAKVDKNNDIIYIWCTGINSSRLKKIKVNKNQTLEEQQNQGKRPRFSIENQIIKQNDLKPNYKFDILNKKIYKM